MSLNFETVNALVAQFGTMRFFPTEPAMRLALVETMGEMCETEDQVRWLVKRVRTLYSEWPGEREMRACFCSRFKSKDGISADSTVFIDGLPSENLNRNLEIEGPKMKALPAGRIVTADKTLDARVAALAAHVNSLTGSANAAPATPEEIAAAPEWLRRIEGYEDPPTR